MANFLFFLFFILPILLVVGYVFYFNIVGVNNKLTMDSLSVEKSLLKLISIIVKADGKASPTELKTIENYINKNHSLKRAKTHHLYFKEYLQNTYEIKDIVKKMDYVDVVAYQKSSNGRRGSIFSKPITSNAHRVKWLHFLVGFAVCDKVMSIKEYNVLNTIRHELKLNQTTFNSILAMFNYYTEEELNRQKTVKQYKLNSIDRYYKVLGVSSSASTSDIKSAYRTMVKLYHPDKQSFKKQDKDTKDKFHQVQDAYEAIKKHRRM